MKINFNSLTLLGHSTLKYHYHHKLKEKCPHFG